MTTLVTSPALVLPNKDIQITFNGAASGTNFIRYSVTSAPEGSELWKKLKASKAARKEVDVGDYGVPFRIKFDRGGVYTFFVEEIQRGSAFNGDHEGDTDGAPSETLLASSSKVVYVGQRLDLKMGFGPDTAKLRVYVFNDSVRATNLAEHDIVTPDLVEPTTQKARNACTYVGSNIDVLVDETYTDILGNVNTVFGSLRATLADHMGNATAHNGADTYNPLNAAYGASSPAVASASISALRRSLESHMSDTDETGPGEGGYHDASDNRTRFAAPGASTDRLSQMVALSDIWRVYEIHRLTASGVHNSADVTNVAAALPPLMDLHRQFIEGLETTTPTVPNSINSAAAYLTQMGGFVES